MTLGAGVLQRVPDAASKDERVAHQDASQRAPLVEAAIMRVLDAERAARVAAEAAHGQAAERVQQARARAIAIAKRTERRIRAIQAAFEQRVEAESRAVDAELAALVDAEVEDAQTRLLDVDAAEKVAAELTGGEHG